METKRTMVNGQQEAGAGRTARVEGVREVTVGAGRRPLLPRAIAVGLGACLALSALPSAAAGPDEPESVAVALSRLRAGQYVRIADAEGDDGAEGRLVAVRDGQLVLEGLGDKMPIESAREVWVRGRHTKRGALVGGAVGVFAGAALGLATWAIATDDCADSCDKSWPAFVGGGMAIVGATGAATGALVGSTVPRWEPVYSTDADSGRLRLSFEPSSDGSSAPDPIGAASLHLGYNKATHALAPGGGPSGRLSLAADFGRVSPSIEIGRYELGGRDVLTAQGERRYDESLVHVGPAVSIEMLRGKIRPYAVAGLGYYRWNVIGRPNLEDNSCPHCDLVGPSEFLGGSLGGGVRARATDQLSFGLEGRWHTNLTDIGEAARHGEERDRFNLLSVTAGATLSW